MKHLAYLNKYLLKYKWHILLGTAFIIVSNYFGVLMPTIVDDAVDGIEKFIEEINTIQSNSVEQSAIYRLGLRLFLFFLLFAVLKGVFLFFTRQTIIVMSRRIEFDLKNEIYNKYQALSFSFFKENSTGDIMNRISEDVSRVRMYLGPAIMYTINVAVLFVMVITMMIRKSPELTLYVLLPLPIMSYIVYKVSSVINKRSEVTQRQQSALSTFVQEAFSGIRVLKAFGREKYFTNKFDEENEHYRAASLKLAKVNALFVPAIVSLIGLSTVITIYIGGIRTINGNLDVGDIAQFVLYVNMLTWPFASVGWVSSLVQRAAASQERVNEFLKTEIEIKEIANPVSENIEEIEFRNVSFTYSNTGIEALKALNFSIKNGETIAITGKTGSGKSSISFLLERLFDTTAGEILLNGITSKHFALSSLRGQIGYVPQDVFLFSDTIYNNIAFGLSQEEISEEKVIQAAKDAHIHDNIIGFEKGYETRVGERGVTLSGGQKQRISIARAIIRDPQVLIFDDCLSAVDTETEEIILSNLKRIMKGKTSIVISHRTSSLKGADRILVLDEGCLSEMGTHDELLQKKGLYHTIYQQQQLEQV